MRARLWRLRRLAADLRQLDVCLAVGISQARCSLVERGEVEPSDAERKAIESILPLLPARGASTSCGGKASESKRHDL